jgi:hypothetical protein
VQNTILLLFLSIILAQPLRAGNDVVARQGDLPADTAFVPVSLDSVANDSLAVAFPSDRIQIQGVPFDLVKNAAATHLFLKPIGWSAAKDESGEYPEYIAKYDMRVANTNNSARALVQVPVADYAAIWLLATTDNDRSLTNLVTFRFAALDGQWRTTYHDFVGLVPRADEKKPKDVLKVIPGPAGNLYLLRIPMGKTIAQDFKDRKSFDLDITKQLRVAINRPDPYRFQLRPLGPSSGVRIYGLTLERAPLQMEVTGAEAGNVFNEPQVPTFHLDIQNLRNQPGKFDLRAIVEGDEGVTKTHSFPAVDFHSGTNTRRTIAIRVPQRGHYELKIQLLRGKELVANRETTFALLAPDTRKHRDQSPFGTWDFGGSHFTPSDPELLGPLCVKAGLRYGLPLAVPQSQRQRFGVLSWHDPGAGGANEVKTLLDQLAKTPDVPAPSRFLIFHETHISGPHITRTPDMFTGRPPYRMNADEEKRFQELLHAAENAFRGTRPAFPKAEIYLGNGTPHLIEEFLRRKFPRELIDKVGNESGNYMRLPETQPPDYIANNAGLWMFRQILDHYGYSDVGLRQCYEMCYPNTNPGNLTERTQAAYIVRHMMHSLAWRIPVIRPMCITDMGGSYYSSNWGASGFCHAWPNVSPKQSYVAFATMTQVLDGAKFVRAVPVKSTVVYAVEFQRPDQSYVTCLWTPRGSRALTVQAPGANAQSLTDLMGRERRVAFKSDTAELTISSEPCYLTTPGPIASITLGAVNHDGRPGSNAFLVSSLDTLADWTVETGHSIELETYNFLNPRRKGEFVYRDVASFEGEQNVLEAKPTLPCEGSPYLQMYSVLSHNRGVEIPGEPTEIGLMVNGNGGWGRVIFELEDASGQRWISIGAEQSGPPMPWMADWLKPEEFAKMKTSNLSDWNSDDAWGRSFINHDGWRFVSFQLPGQYPGEGYHWPRNSQWRSSGDGVVKYPLKFRELVITMPEKVLYLTQYIPPPRYEIYLKDLMVTYKPAEKVFAGE